ncbi:putative clathrin assembly protein At4g40080 [Andrographis paniculata]|uniref:putative clathrin assembly protein At4g40080 n=1 Tax=Andrographis paniculata TaxID=175694 RepID=UPI0021E861BA|nr:putative clathrin assembly protein At4g40080 [Andrographis paniculata]
MGRTVSLRRRIVALLKDKASLSKASFLSAASLRLALLRATTHHPPTPPDDRRLSDLLLLGQTSRAAASPLISALMDRLHRTGDSVVALKCLLIVHHIIRRGPFILQDQLSIFPAAGGHNYLNLSAFRDGAAWSLSRWVRWYARYLETLLSTSRAFGYFLCSSAAIKDSDDLRISSFLNSDLVREIDALAALVEEICKLPDADADRSGDGALVKEIIGFIIGDYLTAANELLRRLGEAGGRLACLSFGDSFELVCALKRLLNCRETLSAICVVQKPSIEMMWSTIEELKDRIQKLQVYRDGGKFLILGTRAKPSESARFDGRVIRVGGDSVEFHSGRF